MPPVRWFKPILTTVGVLYLLLASSMLVRGAGLMRDFEVPEVVVTSPVFADFFSFFYQLMAFLGVLTLVFSRVVTERSGQLLVARVFCVANVLITMRDLSTSDSALGNHLYKGQATLMPVVIDVLLTVAFGVLSSGPNAPSPASKR
jgi:hypothetical protein